MSTRGKSQAAHAFDEQGYKRVERAVRIVEQTPRGGGAHRRRWPIMVGDPEGFWAILVSKESVKIKPYSDLSEEVPIDSDDVFWDDPMFTPPCDQFEIDDRYMGIYTAVECYTSDERRGLPLEGGREVKCFERNRGNRNDWLNNKIVWLVPVGRETLFDAIDGNESEEFLETSGGVEVFGESEETHTDQMMWMFDDGIPNEPCALRYNISADPANDQQF